MMTGRSPGGVVGLGGAGVADVPLPLLGVEPEPVDGLMAGADVGPAAGARVTTGTGVATDPAGATAPRTIQPVTPLWVSRTWRQVWPSTSRSGPSTSMLEPSASVFKILPLAPGSARMFAPWPLVLPTWPRDAELGATAVVGRGAAGVFPAGAAADDDDGAPAGPWLAPGI